MRDRDEISLLIDGVEFRFWDALALDFGLDNYTTIAFTAPFDHTRAEFRRVFRPFAFRDLEVLLAGETLFRGNLVDIQVSSDAAGARLDLSGYSRPGRFHACRAPASALPLEFQGLTLDAIVQTIARPFGIGVDVRADVGRRFEKAALEPTGVVQDFFVDLAKQRGLVLSNNANGDVVLWRSVDTGAPVARLREGESPLVNVRPSFDPEACYSEITCYGSAKRGRAGGKFTVANPHLTTIARPFGTALDDTDPADVPSATRAALGRMWGNAATYSIEGLPTWRTPAGALWAPNATVTVDAPSAMIYRETELLIRGVRLRASASAVSADLDLVLPGAFSGAVPEVLPWDE